MDFCALLSAEDKGGAESPIPALPADEASMAAAAAGARSQQAQAGNEDDEDARARARRLEQATSVAAQT